MQLLFSLVMRMPSGSYQVRRSIFSSHETIQLCMSFIVCLGAALEQLFKDAPSVELPSELLASDDLTILELAVRTDTVPSNCE